MRALSDFILILCCCFFNFNKMAFSSALNHQCIGWCILDNSAQVFSHYSAKIDFSWLVVMLCLCIYPWLQLPVGLLLVFSFIFYLLCWCAACKMEDVCKLMSWKVTQGLSCIVVPQSTKFSHAHGGHHSINMEMEKVIYATACLMVFEFVEARIKRSGAHGKSDCQLKRSILKPIFRSRWRTFTVNYSIFETNKNAIN